MGDTTGTLFCVLTITGDCELRFQPQAGTCISGVEYGIITGIGLMAMNGILGLFAGGLTGLL